MKTKILKTATLGLMAILTLIVSIAFTKNVFINIKYLYSDDANAKAFTCLMDLIK